jgi:hypothetical protein
MCNRVFAAKGADAASDRRMREETARGTGVNGGQPLRWLGTLRLSGPWVRPTDFPCGVKATR